MADKPQNTTMSMGDQTQREKDVEVVGEKMALVDQKGGKDDTLDETKSAGYSKEEKGKGKAVVGKMTTKGKPKEVPEAIGDAAHAVAGKTTTKGKPKEVPEAMGDGAQGKGIRVTAGKDPLDGQAMDVEMDHEEEETPRAEGKRNPTAGRQFVSSSILVPYPW